MGRSSRYMYTLRSGRSNDGCDPNILLKLHGNDRVILAYYRHLIQKCVRPAFGIDGSDQSVTFNQRSRRPGDPSLWKGGRIGIVVRHATGFLRFEST